MENQIDTSPSINDSDADIRKELAGTRPWVMFIAIILFIGAGFMLLGGLGSLASFLFIGPIGGPDLGSDAGFAIGTGIAIGIAYVLFSLFYLLPAILLLRYANKIEVFLKSNDRSQLVDTLMQQRKFWKFVGILTVVMIALSIIGGILAVLGAFFMGF